MKIKKYNHVTIVLFGLMLTLLPQRALAFCPLCMIATGTVAGVFRWLGVDDSIVGLWLGGFILSSIFLFNNYLIRKNKRIPLQLPLLMISFYSLTAFFLFWSGFIVPYNTIFGVNKVWLGMFLGSLLLIIASGLQKLLRRLNHGKIFISHQKVLVALGLLFICSLILYFLIR